MALIKALRKEMERAEKILAVYESLPNGAGMFGAMAIKVDISIADNAIDNLDAVTMVASLKTLKKLHF